jgi:single-stranded DNA-specific DHH superfamily exonuclease
MAEKDFDGLSEFELIKQLNKKKKKYCALILTDVEELGINQDVYKKIRKIVLDNMNDYTRGVFSLVGINIEGYKDE